MLRPALIACMLMTTALPGAAQNVAFGGIQADTSAPVEMSADNLTVNQADGSAVFTGNVIIAQGEMKLQAGEVTVIYAEGGQQRIESLKATGGVTLASGTDAAEAQEALYEVETGMIDLTGDVIMTQGQNVLTGDKMRVNLADGTAQAQGRVRTVLQPGGN
ncbi:lipopolysaccharide transport periplasmic protein LptA [Paracoccus tegillarcae]|uniref:Lipopolysaccharide transport periplasmic protein LptA n=1 Tax=Paracoccus tegillarcae TaxID=1529068 RepID=A0A2K9EEN1_9RHOB|nr:lipopolysaccharide transport periplasmic protein LptA [Paracoccus tegillarcae]AUH32779.1 lipopolysaccharide transport periplasmic protein LptA [Paracoccus tegillarcae]